MLVEWRGARVESIKLEDKKSGKIEDRMVVRHGVECGDVQISVSEWVPRGAEKPKISYERGTKFLLVVRSYRVEKGSISCSGDFVSLGQPF